ncbi:hypothetical protein [Chroococcidiopsis sp. CCMEE 29]|jgi:hypothetical protein|uniref:hypothetical protein n=1 Tax=Chroococcidiopsis sp. CCMEE 29 TaxID=155894 RepID=UPI002021F409|nr:hypothetical protein [Chroococcidiopsis sp. CCMEE 29]
MPGMNSLQLEVEIEKLARAMMTRNREIGNDLINYLRTQFPVEAVAGLMIVSIERLIWFDIDSVLWTIEHLIPADVMQEIKRITTFSVYQRLISKGFTPGQEFSVDANGKLLLNDKARTSVLCC